MSKLPIAVQMYTVRDDAQRDFAGTIEKISSIGYGAVELAGNGGLSTRSLKALLDDNGLKIAGSHTALERMDQALPQVIDENLALGNPNVVAPYIAEQNRTREYYTALAGRLNEWGETLGAHGLTLSYHNHDFEFKGLPDGGRGMDILLSNTDPALVKLEVDTYWVMVAGLDPVAYLNEQKARLHLVHLKDRDLTDGSFAEIGTGDLPLDAIIEAAQAARAAYLIVEQDTCKRPPLESIRISYENLKARGYA
ncbi:MAG: sugar phosphate isomerase/epimerase family protein [Capsulimonadaceae bacterium]